MHFKVFSGLLVATLVALAAPPAFGQSAPIPTLTPMTGGPIDKWQAVPQGESGLVVIVDDKIDSINVGDARGIFEAAKLSFGGPFIRQYRLPPGNYRIDLTKLRLAEPITGINVFTRSGLLTYVRISRRAVGTVIESWRGSATQEVVRLLTSAEKIGLKDAFQFIRVNPASGVIHINTEPPVAIPPQPPPKR